MLYAENADIVGTFSDLGDAEDALRRFVGDHPELRDEIGLREFEAGRPVGDFEPALELLRQVEVAGA